MQVDIQIVKGIVVALKANYLIVEVNPDLSLIDTSTQNINLKKIRLLCTKRSRLSFHGSFVCVGDIVTIESIDWKRLRGVVINVDPRNSMFNRPPVANLTDVLIALSLKEPLLEKSHISNFLLTAELSQQHVTVILTKRDLVDQDILDQNIVRLKDWGYEPIAISIVNGDGIDIFYNKINSMKLGVLCGPSGVGKSSLINYLLPQKSIPIGSLSKKLKRGKNTTRHVELFTLKNGSLIADTPGFNKPELSINPHHLSQLFPELRSQLATTNCKFRNCLHMNEPGCGISKNWERYEYYKNYLREILNSHH